MHWIKNVARLFIIEDALTRLIRNVSFVKALLKDRLMGANNIQPLPDLIRTAATCG